MTPKQLKPQPQAKVGDHIRSYDFPGMRGDCWLEGIVTRVIDERVEFVATRRMVEGTVLAQFPTTFTAPQNGTETFFGKITNGLEILADIDLITRTHTASKRFAELIDAAGGYRPTIRCSRAVNRSATRAELVQLARLADSYDQVQQARGDLRRAYRG